MKKKWTKGKSLIILTKFVESRKRWKREERSVAVIRKQKSKADASSDMDEKGW